MKDEEILAIIQSLTLEEKAALCSGADFWTTKPNHAKGIPSLRMADGPHGVRREDAAYEKKTGKHSLPATCFPAECALACSFSPALAYEVGQAMAEEAIDADVGVLLGPGTNIKRSPLGGRNFEYYSEDPVLSGEMSAGLINGIQSLGIGTSLKHFAVNNQETKRLSISSTLDDRAFFDIYLKPFEIAVKKSHPTTVMASYNRINGTYSSDNRKLLTDILRIRFGFDGLVMSDWGAVNDRVEGIRAGLDLEMPFSGGSNDYAIVESVKQGALQEDLLDTACWNILKLVYAYHSPKKKLQKSQCDYEKHYKTVVSALEQSAVLLKNDGILPLASNGKIAVIGEMAKIAHYQGGGSSLINPVKLISFTDALNDSSISYSYADGYKGDTTSDLLISEAKSTAKSADTVILFLGLSDAYECEAFDREHLSISQAQIDVLNAIYEVNTNICVVLCCGSPVETPWLNKTKALLCPYLGGVGVGEAILNLLFGLVNPSGKLAESWPIRLEDTPSYHHFPMGPNEVTYNESIFVGYRYYNTAKIPVQFPFGFGLSYTSFSYSDMRLSTALLEKKQTLIVSFTITNTGDMQGEEITQIYLQRINSAYYQPTHQLVSFTRTSLNTKESKQISIEIPYSDFSFYNPISQSNVVEKGDYKIEVASSSEDILGSLSLTIDGFSLQSENSLYSSKRFYGNIQNNLFPDDSFSEVYLGKRFSNSVLPKKGEYTLTTTMDQLEESFWGRKLHWAVRFVTCKFIRFSTQPEANRKAGIHTADDLPFRNIVLQTNGIVEPETLEGLLNMCNGKHGFFKVIKGFIVKPFYKKKSYLPQVNNNYKKGAKNENKS